MVWIIIQSFLYEKSFNKEKKQMSKDNKAIEYMIEMTNRIGASCATVDDGHVLIFKRSFLQDLLDKNAAQEKIIIFLKRPDFKN